MATRKTSNVLSVLSREQKEVVEEMPQDLRQVYDQLQSKMQQLTEMDIMTRYEVGEIVRDVTKNERKYGEAAITQLAIALFGNAKQDDVLYDTRQLVNTYTRKQLTDLIRRPMRNGRYISWSHLLVLTRLKGRGAAQKRRALEKKIFEEGLSVKELAQEVQQHLGGKQAAGGRKPLAPRSPRAGLQQIIKYRDAIVNRVPLWTDAVFNKIETAAPEECDEDLLQDLQEARQAEEELYTASEGILGQLDRSIERVQRVLEQPAPGPGKSKSQRRRRSVVDPRQLEEDWEEDQDEPPGGGRPSPAERRTRQSATT